MVVFATRIRTAPNQTVERLPGPKKNRKGVRPMDEFTPHSVLAVRDAVSRGKRLTCQHFIYRMSCEDYDALIRRSGGRCEICQDIPKNPAIDHDHSVGDHGVRGLLCRKCNVHMGFVDRGRKPIDEATAKYLSNPFWVTRGLKRSTIRQPGHPRLTRDFKEIEAAQSLWRDVESVADHRGESLSEVIRAALVAYARKHGKDLS